MNKQTSIRVLAAGLALGAVVFMSGNAAALDLRTHVASIYQIGTSAQVQLGHTVAASTDYNRLIAGGTYSASCAASEMQPTTGQRTLTASGLRGPQQLYVTIPANLPARVSMPGFNASTMRGRTLDCTYNWTSRAAESQLTIGAGGIGYTVGGGEMTEGGTEVFSMRVPGLGDVNEGSTCTP